MARDWANASGVDVQAEIDRIKAIEHVPVDHKDYFTRPLDETPEQRAEFESKLHAMMHPTETLPDLMANKYLRLDVSDLSESEFDALLARRRRTWHDNDPDPVLDQAFARQERRGKLAAAPVKP